MIKIIVETDKQTKKIVSLEVKGHASSDEEGKDLVCAAVSAVVIGGFNALINPKDYSIVLQKGLASIKTDCHLSEHDSIVLNTIMISLETIAEGNSDYVSLTKKEI